MPRKQVVDRSVPRLALSLNDLALSLGVSPNTVLRMVEEGYLPRPRVWHRRKLWRVAEIDASLAEWPTDRQGEEDFGDLDGWRAEV